MKVLAALFLLFACTQADEDIMQQAAETVPLCVEEKGLDLGKIQRIMKDPALPVDDAEFTDFFGCYYTKLGFLKDDGDLDGDNLEQKLPRLIRQNFGDVDADKLAKDTLQHCEDAHKDEKGALAAIKLRNCALKYLEQHRVHH